MRSPATSSSPARHRSRVALAAALAPALILAVAGCAHRSATSTATTTATPSTPETIRAPADQVFFLETRATGVQVYECTTRSGAPESWAWIFRAPEATLFDGAGRSIGRHYAGPTWEATDGSIVVGEVRAADPGPVPGAIPWLLLTARSSSETGMFAGTRSIQRVQTEGGLAPAQSCGAANAKQLARVPYKAIYNFFRSAR